jgi:glucose-6-phosphate 1-epimerase
MSIATPNAYPSFVAAGKNHLPEAILACQDGARAEVYLHGAQVTSWIPSIGGERLFLSPKAIFSSGASIRGGVPVIFPQFGTFGPLQKHGFARFMDWELLSAEKTPDRTSAVFQLFDRESSRRLWNHPFQCQLSVEIGGASLSVALAVTNTGSEPFEFTAALHSYLRVDDIRATVIKGLGGLPYLDTVGGETQRVQEQPDLNFTGEVDRVFFNAPAQVSVRGSAKKLLDVSMRGFSDIVVWNPGPELCATLKDMEPDGYLRMLCVEAAVIGQPVHLDPFESWSGSQTLTAY